MSAGKERRGWVLAEKTNKNGGRRAREREGG
jgi:hypothetical protein